MARGAWRATVHSVAKSETQVKQLSTHARLTYRASLVAQMVKNPPAMQETQVRSLGWVDPRIRKCLPIPVFLPGEFHGYGCLVGYSSRGCKELHMTEYLNMHTLHFWTIVSSGSCFCWLHRVSLSSAAKNVINVISVLTIWWCPCVELCLGLFGKGCLPWPMCSHCPASFSTPRPNLPVTPGVSLLPTFAFQSPMMKSISFKIFGGCYF